MNYPFAYKLPNHPSLFTEAQKQRLSEVLKLLDGVSRLPLENDPERAEEIMDIFCEAKKRERK